MWRPPRSTAATAQPAARQPARRQPSYKPGTARRTERQIQVIAVDIGASALRAATTSLDGDLHRRAARPLRFDDTIEDLRTAFREVIAALEPGTDVGAVGVAIPGFLDRNRKVRPGIHLSQMVGMHVAAEFADASGVREVVVLPDLAAAAIAEAAAGADLADRLLCVGLGTGANAALAVAGKVVDVADGALGDAGHVVVEPEGPVCPCGGRGCLEAVCSGIALARGGAHFGLDDGRAVIEAARAGRGEAVGLLDRAGVALGRAIASWAAMTVPDRVAVVGGLSMAGDLLLEPARRELGRIAQPRYAARLPILAGVLGPDAALVGAGMAAADHARALGRALEENGPR